ncbi:SulP family inorganic anion transporter [Anatilimnocola sp. NA78]|uniref:SulP family inorganic anion transporter n=1 Tax=Anatilimnocola sp. NA78 TaxID=3415683 RepID=UPI003CE50F91
MEVQKSSGQAAPAVPFPACLRYDAISGFLVFLIALPLCLAIGRASGFPPIAGVITAIVGGIIAPFFSNSELTIKGPAAGLIAIVVGAVIDFGGNTGVAANDFNAYRMVLAVGLVASIIQIFFGLFKAGKLGDFFPTAAVHGLLASIGVIIMIKQFLTMLGVTAKLPAENLHLIKEYGNFILQLNPYVAGLGILSLSIMALYPFLKAKPFRMIPVQVVVLGIALPLAFFLGIRRNTTPAAAPQAAIVAVAETRPAAPPAEKLVNPYSLGGREFNRDPAKYLINVPQDFRQAFVLPAFFEMDAAGHYTGKFHFDFMYNRDAFKFWKWVLMFSVIASLESLLSAKAVDFIDPQRRKTDLNRDLLGCGIANTIATCIGGLPMISEIVRSRANVDAGAKTRFSNVFHGVFLLLFASLLPFVLIYIPTAALAAMLVFTGFRLAHPRELFHMWQIGKEQLLVFVTTIVAIVLTDLLVGVLIGMALELAINLVRGLPISAIFSPGIQVREEGDELIVAPQHAVTFSNWLPLRSKLETLGLKEGRNVTLDLSRTELVDHTAMEKLHEMERAFHGANLALHVVGLEQHRALSTHSAGARQRFAAAV